jgi:hypothetical protein
VLTNGVLSWLTRDQLGSVRATNTAGAVVEQAQYKPCGERLETVASLMTSEGFTGQRNDETGLVYLHSRYLNPSLRALLRRRPNPMVPEYGNVIVRMVSILRKLGSCDMRRPSLYA